MPTYEYQCKACSHRFEIWQKMTDEPLTICPKCGGTIRRILFPAGVVFKGPGFYKTDHANASGAGENGHSPKTGGAESGKAGETSSGTSGDTRSSSDTSSTSGAKTGEHKAPVGAKPLD